MIDESTAVFPLNITVYVFYLTDVHSMLTIRDFAFNIEITNIGVMISQPFREEKVSTFP